MPLDRFPRAARGDAHLLVVIAGRAAGGEGVAQPEAALERNRIGGVGEGRGALVGGDDEIGIVAVMAHHVVGRHDRAVGGDVVSDVEHGRDEQRIGGDAFGRDRLARAAERQEFRNEAALGADRHDHGVLDLLRLDQPQNLGAEILRPVRPADAAARDLAEAQMHALDARRIDEDFVERPRQGKIVDLAAVELDRDQGFRPPVRVELVEVGADRRADRIHEMPNDAILVEALHLGQRRLDLGGDRVFLSAAQISERAETRIEAGLEQTDELRGDAGVLAQGRPHVVLRERDADLPQVARQRADQRDIAPPQAGVEHQRVVAVILGDAAHHDQEAAFERLLRLRRCRAAAVDTLQHHVVQPDAARVLRRGGDFVGALVDDPEAHIFQDRDAFGQRDRPVVAPDFQAGGLGPASGADRRIRPPAASATTGLR